MSNLLQLLLVASLLQACGPIGDVRKEVEKGNEIQERILAEEKAMHKSMEDLIKILTGGEMNCQQAVVEIQKIQTHLP